MSLLPIHQLTRSLEATAFTSRNHKFCCLSTVSQHIHTSESLEHGPQIQHSSLIALFPVSIMPASHRIGQRVSYDGALCTVRFVGEVAGTAGTWLGVEWDDATRGKHDGCHKGVRYFSCNLPSGRALFLLCSVCLTDVS